MLAAARRTVRVASVASARGFCARGAARAPRPSDMKSNELLNKSGEEEDDDDVDLVEMFNPETGEWNGPRYEKEPTRYGDWEIKGRCTDFV